MQPQHYVPLVFITFLGFCLCIHSILESVSASKVVALKSISNIKSFILVILTACLIFLNLFNEARIINKIRVTGGENCWASEMTELADEAIDNKDNGVKEVYVFQDWGFFTGFDYLTMNNIPYVTSIDEDNLTQYYNEGNDIVACYWNEDNASTYAEVYENISGGNGAVTTKKWIDNNGKTEFYEMRLSHEKQEIADE